MARKPRKIQTIHVEELENELCVYDWQRKEVHNLNRTAALVWELCDGHTSPTQMAATLRAEFDTPYAEDVVWMALQELEQAHLLESTDIQPVDRSLMSRRTLIKRMGVAAALLPVVVSIVTPGPVQAQTPGDCTPNPNAETIGTWRPASQSCSEDPFFDELILTSEQVLADVQELCPCDGEFSVEFAEYCGDCYAAAVRQNADFYRYGREGITQEGNCLLIWCNDNNLPS